MSTTPSADNNDDDNNLCLFVSATCSADSGDNDNDNDVLSMLPYFNTTTRMITLPDDEDEEVEDE